MELDCVRVAKGFLRLLFGRRAIITLAMKSTLAIILKPIRWGWAVCLSDGRELARFRGPGAQWRALHHARECLV